MRYPGYHIISSMSKKKPVSNDVVHILVDTSVWLDLAKQGDGGKTVAIIREMLNQGKIQLIVPQLVMDEFERNRDRVKEAMTRSVSARFREVRKAIDEYGRGDRKQKVLEELDNLMHQVPIVNELATQTFDAIFDLLHLGKVIAPTSEIKERVLERALTKRAPFHREKNSVADALLIEMYGNAAKVATPTDRYCFITHNVKDFSAIDGDMRQPHEDFAEFFSAPYSRYFNSLQAALIAYFPSEFEDLDLNFDFYEEPRPLSEVLPYLNKLWDQIWYNRHKNLEYKIESGEHRLVNRYQPENFQTTTVRSVWKTAQENARKIEEKYGLEELGPWDDFEWGMLNGKMSAIRWMLGEDWESTLDT